MLGKSILISGLILFSSCTDAPQLNVGSEARISAPGSDKEVLVAIDVKALEELTNSFIAKDWHGVGEVYVSGRAFPVDNLTRVLIIDSGFGKRKIRILEGKQNGRAGWLPGEYLAPIK